MQHRIALGALAIAVVACNDPPVVAVQSPSTGTVITDHAPVVFDVKVVEDELVLLELLLDGEPVTATLDPPLPTDGAAACHPCTFTVTWSGADASEGEHELAVLAIDDHGAGGEDTVTMGFEDTPTATLSNPDGSDLLGVSDLTVTVGVVDRSAVDAEVRLDDVVQSGVTVSGDCRFGCSVSWPWDTTPLTGAHDLTITVVDPFGRGATVEQTVVVGDIPYATRIGVLNESDNIGFGGLEIEVHIEDADTGAHIACSGEQSGLEQVDESSHIYDVLAHFTDTAGNTISMDSLAGRNVTLHVMEDDTLPCPSATDLGTDDVVGVSQPMSAGSLAGSQAMTFGNVETLQMNAGRPYQR